MKLFSSSKKLHQVFQGYTFDQCADIQSFVTAQKLTQDKVALDVKPNWLASVATSKAVLAGCTNRIIKCTSHGARVGDIVRFTNADNIGVEATVLSVVSANEFILASELIDAPSVTETFDVLRPITPTVSTSGTITVTLPDTDIVDQIDTTPLLDVSVSNIPASSALPLEVVASLAADCRKILTVDDIGEFIGLYTGAAGAEVLKCVLPIAGGCVELELSAGDRISLRNMKDATINTATFIAINFLG